MRCRRGLIILLFALLWCAAPARAAVITFDSVAVGENGEFTLEIRVSDVDDLFTFGFDLVFNPAIIQPVAVAEGSFLSSGLTPGGEIFFFGGDTSTLGLLSSVSGSLFNQALGASGSGILATITFQSLVAGNAGLEFANVFFFDSAFPQGNLIPVDLLPGVVTVGAVPEPSTLLLVGLGLAALTRSRRRRRASRV
jgi:hypothetical protein